MHPSLTLLALSSIFLGAACAPAPSSLSASDSTQVVEEARQFMAAYAKDLLAGNRAGIAARYDTTGAYVLGNGFKAFHPRDSIVAQYASQQWQAPSSFEWLDLSYEPITRDAIAIAGRFRWVMTTPPMSMVMSYSSLLRRQGGVLKIRLEDESANPMEVPRPPADSASRK